MSACCLCLGDFILAYNNEHVQGSLCCKAASRPSAVFICPDSPGRGELIREQRLREVPWAVPGRKARELWSQDVNPGHPTEKSCSHAPPHTHTLCISSLVGMKGEALCRT